MTKRKARTMQKISFIVPVYNERHTFEPLLKRLLKVKLPIEREIIVIEGNSTDGTRKIVHKYDKHPLVKTFYIDYYCGKGHKVRFGMKKATGDIIAIQDADLEYEPEEYPTLIQPILLGSADFVLGSRHLGKGGDWQIREFDRSRWWAKYVNVGSEAIVLSFKALYGKRLTDPQTMFKIFTKDCLKGVHFVSEHFDLDWEIVCKFVRKGVRVVELPASYHARSFEEGKKIQLFRDGVRAIRAIIRFRFGKL